MTQAPPELDHVLRLFHETIDRQFDNQIRRLEEERREKHEHIETFITSFLNGIIPQSAQAAMPFPPYRQDANGNGHAATNGNARKFAMKETIRNIIAAAPGHAEIDQPSLYIRLTAEYPALRERVEGHVRGQISGVLSKLVDEGFLVLYRRGLGGAPHVYRKVIVGTPEVI